MRFRETFGPIGVALQAGYMKSAAVGYSVAATSATQRYKGWDFSNWGVAITYGGLTVGGHVMASAFDGGGNLAPQGTRNAFVYLAGASCTTGPVILGASFYQLDSVGSGGSTPASRVTASLAAIGQARDRGLAAAAPTRSPPG